jgi:hypothetical protein
MKQFKIKIDEKVSIWQRVTMWVEAEDEQALRKQIETNSFDVVDICNVDDFPETMDHIEYDSDYFDILDEEECYGSVSQSV